MGKQRKGGTKAKGKNQKERKEQKKEKRAQTNEDAKRKASREEVEAIFDELHLDNSLLVGRLYYFLPNFAYDRNDVNSRRGILEKVIGDEADDANSTAVFVPVVPLDESDSQRVTVPLGNVVRQRVAWTLRHGVGDSVVVYDKATDAYVEATVEYLWPVWQSPKKAFGKDRSDKLVLYQCRTMDMEHRIILVSKDEDRYIQKLPTSFRFPPGDRVLVSVERAYCRDAQNNAGLSKWHTGTITDTHVLDRSRYSHYECELDNSGVTCYIVGDSDAFVTSASSSPRQRLFSAMEDPEFTKEELSFLVESYEIDTSAFFDLVVTKAMESASYAALHWLAFEKHLEMDSVQDADGNGVLHQIARSPYAERFLKPASEALPASQWRCYGHFLWQPAIELNGLGQTWVELLVENPTVSLHSLELALSPDVGLGRLMSQVTGDHTNVIAHRLASLREEAWSRRQFEVARMINYLLFTFPVYEAVQAFFRNPADLEDLFESGLVFERLEGCREEDFSNWFMSVLFETCAQSEGAFVDVTNRLFRAASKGKFRTVELLLNRIPALANLSFEMLVDTVDRNEFHQEYRGVWKYESWISLSLVDAVAMTRTDENEKIYLEPSVEERQHYFYRLRLYCSHHRNECDTIFDYFAKEKAELPPSERHYEKLLLHRAALLKDDASLENRLRVLGTLIKQHGATPPNLVDLARWRQRGVLRWLDREYSGTPQSG